MGITSGLDIDFEEAVDPIQLINDLIDFGWTYDDGGKISYIPVGDNDLFEWQEESLENWNKVLEIIQEKIAKNEVIALILTWRDTQIGGHFIISEDRKCLMISLSVDRQTIGNSRKTNFDWYEGKIVTALKNHGYKLDNAQFSEFS